MTLSPNELKKHCEERASKHWPRIERQRRMFSEFTGRPNGDQKGMVQGQYADGRPALRDLSDFHDSLQTRPGAPNWIKPALKDKISLLCPLPTTTFEPESDSDDDQKTAELVSRVVRGQHELSQLDVTQVSAVTFMTVCGNVAYTLDPLTPKSAQESDDPFALPGVYINVHDPSISFPRFGTGREFNRVQDLFLYFQDSPKEHIEHMYPNATAILHGSRRADIIVHYAKDYKCIIVASGQQAVEVFRDDHKYGFCPAEWAINESDGTQFGVSEIDQAISLQRNSQSLFHLAMDASILATFPPMHVHQPEHVGRVRYGPLAVIETVEDGSVTPLSSQVNVQVPSMLLDLSESNLLQQIGTSPLRQQMDIQHANISGRAINNAQGSMDSRIAMNNVLLGSALEWLNSKIAMILYTDKSFKNTQMSVYSTDSKGKKQNTTFKGSDLQGLWRNHVQWANPMGSNKHEEMVMYLQLHDKGLVPGSKVLEAMNEDDPERLIAEAKAEQQQMQQSQMGAPPGPGGPPPPGGGAPDQALALSAGGMPSNAPGGPSQGPAQPPPGAGASPPQGPSGPQMPGFPPLQAPPGSPPGGSTPVPDIFQEVQQITQSLPLKGQIVEVVGTSNGKGKPKGIRVTVTDHRDVAILKTALKSVAEMLAGPGGQVDVVTQK